MKIYWVSVKNHDTDEWLEAMIEADDGQHALEKFLRRTSIRNMVHDAAMKFDGPDRLTFALHQSRPRPPAFSKRPRKRS